MPKLSQIQRGPQRLIFNNAFVLSVDMEVQSGSFSTFGGMTQHYAAGPAITTVKFYNQPGAFVSEPIDIDAIRARVTGASVDGVINPDAMLLLERLDNANDTSKRHATDLAREQRDYEASKNLWRKRYDDQPDYSEYDDDWDDYR